jgi:hypothetical protein
MGAEDTACLHYPWAIAPTTIRTKPVATAIATFAYTSAHGRQFFDLHRYPLRLRLFDAADSRIRRPGTICNRNRPV